MYVIGSAKMGERELRNKAKHEKYVAGKMENPMLKPLFEEYREVHNGRYPPIVADITSDDKLAEQIILWIAQRREMETRRLRPAQTGSGVHTAAAAI